MHDSIAYHLRTMQGIANAILNHCGAGRVSVMAKLESISVAIDVDSNSHSLPLRQTTVGEPRGAYNLVLTVNVRIASLTDGGSRHD